MDPNWDVVIVGAGNAAMCAAIAAHDAGARVLVLEWAPQDQRGGNSAFTSGAFRVAYDGVEDLRALMPELSDAEWENLDFGVYGEDAFFEDLARLSNYRLDQALAELLVRESRPTLRWMRDQGVRFIPIYGRQAFKVDGRMKFWGGLSIEVSGGGPGLVASLATAVERRSIPITYGARAMELLREGGVVSGVRILREGRTADIAAPAVILASGGFHANAEWRARYLGSGWDLAKVKGSRFNVGDGIRMALEAGAMSCGHWSGCHATAYDANAPEFGELERVNLAKNSFWLGIMVNRRGQRFVDEGADYRNYIYSHMGHAILRQPNQVAWQIFDQRVAPLLTDEYRGRLTRVTGATLEELAAKLEAEGVNREGFLEEVRRFNAAVNTAVPFQPAVKDGRSTNGLAVDKSNWANPLDMPPFVAVGVTCGVTFTYGGVKVNEDAAVLSGDGKAIAGLYAAGELVGGLYYDTYPGGAGLTSGAVFGRIAGERAARFALTEAPK